MKTNQKLRMTLHFALAALAWGIAASTAIGQTVVTNGCLVVTCPPNRTNVLCGPYVFEDAGISVTNQCPEAPPPFEVQCVPPVGTSFRSGLNSVTCRVTANGAAIADCQFFVVVRSTIELPSFTSCPTGGGLFIPCPSNCVSVTYPLPEVTNGILMSCEPPSGSCFPVGLNFVTCIATNNCGDKTGCSFPVRVLTEPPVILCRTDEIQVSPPCHLRCATVDYALPEVRGGTLIECTPPPGSCFPTAGPTGGTVVRQVTCRATNDCGALAQCSFRIRVTQDPNQFLKPDFDFPPPHRVVTNQCGSDCVQVFYSLPRPRYGVLDGCNPPPGTCLPVGTNVVTCRATNSCGLEGFTGFYVRVVPAPAQPLVINCPTNIIAFNCSNDCRTVNYALPVVSPGASVVCTPPPGTCFVLGTTPVHCVASNECGTASCEFRVTVERRDEPFAFQCPTNRALIIQCTSNCVPVEYETPLANHAASVVCTPPSGTCFPIGFNQVLCLATNDCGAVSVCHFMVRVVAALPIIRCPSDIETFAPTCNSTSFCAEVNYPLPEVTGGTLVECNPPPGTCFPSSPPGSVTTHRVTCRATNNCGVSVECAFSIRVGGDATGPRIQQPYTSWVTNHCGSNCVPAFYRLPPVANGTLLGCHPPPGTCLPVGRHEVYCRATNACASEEAFIVVRVVQGPPQAPTIQIVHQEDDYLLFWEHECHSILETSKEPDGPWEAIPAASPGYRVAPSERRQYFRVVVPR